MVSGVNSATMQSNTLLQNLWPCTSGSDWTMGGVWRQRTERTSTVMLSQLVSLSERPAAVVAAAADATAGAVRCPVQR